MALEEIVRPDRKDDVEVALGSAAAAGVGLTVEDNALFLSYEPE